MTSLYYIEFIGDDGSDEAVTIQAPSEGLARSAIGPRRITRVIRLPGTQREPIEWTGKDREVDPWIPW